jgi:hypothetical protein
MNPSKNKHLRAMQIEFSDRLLVLLQRLNEAFLSSLPLRTEPVCRPTDGNLKPLQTNLCRGFLKDKTYSALTGLDNWLPECRRNAPDNLLLSAKRRRPCRVCPCECRPASQKEVVGRSICYPSGHEKIGPFGQIGADIPGTYSSLVLSCSFGERGAGRHEQPEGNGAKGAKSPLYLPT